jgi:hypothetical protein
MTFSRFRERPRLPVGRWTASSSGISWARSVRMGGRRMIRKGHASRICETINEDSLALAAAGHALTAACASRLRGD